MTHKRTPVMKLATETGKPVPVYLKPNRRRVMNTTFELVDTNNNEMHIKLAGHIATVVTDKSNYTIRFDDMPNVSASADTFDRAIDSAHQVVALVTEWQS